jgi:hypothetical protein
VKTLKKRLRLYANALDKFVFLLYAFSHDLQIVDRVTLCAHQPPPEQVRAHIGTPPPQFAHDRVNFLSFHAGITFSARYAEPLLFCERSKNYA